MTRRGGNDCGAGCLEDDLPVGMVIASVWDGAVYVEEMRALQPAEWTPGMRAIREKEAHHGLVSRRVAELRSHVLAAPFIRRWEDKGMVEP